MKKVIALILSLVLILSMSVPAFAKFDSGLNMTSSVPVIYLSGDGNELYYDNETKSFAIKDMLKIYKNSEDGNVSEAAFNILYPFILKGIAFNQWDDYYEAVYKELSDVYEPIKLDENGNVPNDCGIPTWEKNDLQDAMTNDRANADGRYSEKTYMFYYDWRLDPNELADQLNEYIEGVKKATGHDKVSLSSKCLGSNTVLAYINKYGTDSLKGVGIDVSTTNGADFISGMISGKFGIDGNAISRFAKDLATREDDSYGDIINFAATTMDLLENTGVIDTLTDVAREQLYAKIEYGIVSALARSTFFTFPGYWAVVSQEDFDSAIEYVFGKAGDEKRDTYKGLIEKITTYNNEVKKNAYSIMKTLEAGKVNTCIISKYGVQLVPLIKDGSVLGDEYVSVKHSSFGATTSNVYDTLSDKYIAAQTEKGLGKYISPDKKIDASTCLFPDYTWFIKGADHADYTTYEVSILLTVLDADRQLTIDDFDWTQFIVYDRKTGEAEPMTKDNCNVENWLADSSIDQAESKPDKLHSMLSTLFNWLKTLFNLFTSIIKKSA